jgi:hypothetical protein
MEADLDLLASLLLEGGDDFRNCLVLLEIEPLVPPDDKVGAAGAERRQNERSGENENSAAHQCLS